MYAECCGTTGCNVPVEAMPKLSLQNGGHASGWEEYVTKERTARKKAEKGWEQACWEMRLKHHYPNCASRYLSSSCNIMNEYSKQAIKGPQSSQLQKLQSHLRDLQQTVAEEKLWVFCHKSKLFTLIKHTPSQAFSRKNHLSYMCKID